MNKELIQKNKNIRKNRPIISKDILYSTYENNGVFQICFKSRGCKNYLNGSCIMCDYGVGENISKDELEKAFDMALLESKEDINVLLLNSFGSVLDTNEISEECFISLLNKIKNTDIKRIIFETHYNTIIKEKLELIKEELKNKTITFEMGLETSNENIRSNNLLKFIDNKEFLKTVKLIHSFDMSVIANILVGIPFLSLQEQIENALTSIEWCIKNKIDEIDLFPINIKPYTLLEEFYKSNDYDVISHWELIEVLNRVPEDYLSKIFLAWYGNRDLEYDNEVHSIFPKSCFKCHNNLMEFYAKYLSNSKAYYRRKLLDELISSVNCNCYEKVLRKLSN